MKKELTINTTAGPIKVMSLEDLLEKVKIEQIEEDNYSFNKRLDVVGPSIETVYQRNYIPDDAFMPMSPKIAKAWIMAQSKGVRFVSLRESGPFLQLIENEVSAHMSEFSNPTALVKMGKRLWTMIDINSLRILMAPNGAALISDKKSAISLVEVHK